MTTARAERGYPQSYAEFQAWFGEGWQNWPISTGWRDVKLLIPPVLLPDLTN